MESTQVLWRQIPGLSGDYEISNRGEVRSRKTGHYRKLKTKLNRKTGYCYVSMSRKGNKPLTRSIHRLVAEAFLQNKEGFSQVNHKIEDKTDNRVENLEWCDASYNNSYSKHKRQKRVVVKTPEGEKLATFESETVAAQFLGVNKPAVSAAVINGTSCVGFLVERTV